MDRYFWRKSFYWWLLAISIIFSSSTIFLSTLLWADEKAIARLDQSCPAPVGWRTGSENVFGLLKAAQSFTPTMTDVIYVELAVAKVGNPSSDIVLELCEDKNGEPGKILKSINKSPKEITIIEPDKGLVKFEINYSDLVPGLTYWLVLRRNEEESPDWKNSYIWLHTGDSYPEGRLIISSNSRTWQRGFLAGGKLQEGDFDFIFSTYGTTKGTVLSKQELEQVRNDKLTASRISDGPGMRESYDFSEGWKISPLQFFYDKPEEDNGLKQGWWKVSFDDNTWEEVEVPHDWWITYRPGIIDKFEKEKYNWAVGWYRNRFFALNRYRDKRAIFHFDIVDYQAKVYVNGKNVGTHSGIWTPFEIDVTDSLVYGAENSIVVRVEDDVLNYRNKTFHVEPMVSGRWLRFHAGGIIQPVKLIFKPQVYFSRVLINSRLDSSGLEVDCEIMNSNSRTEEYVLRVEVIPWKEDNNGDKNPPLNIARNEPVNIQVTPGLNEKKVIVKLENPVCWSTDTPFLYNLKLSLWQSKGMVEERIDRFGFREFRAKSDGFYLNNNKIYLQANWLASAAGKDPGMEYLSTPGYIKKLFLEMKANGYNMIRLHKGPWPSWFNNMADEMGIIIMAEWGEGFIVGEYKDDNKRQMKEWLYRDYNHPSLVMWSLSNEIYSEEMVGQLADYYNFFKPLDKQGRPVSPVSGGNVFMEPTVNNTDFYDVHLYFGVGGYPASYISLALEGLQKEVKKYRGKIDKPFFLTECAMVFGGDINTALDDEKIKRYSLDEYLKTADKLGDEAFQKTKMMPLASYVSTYGHPSEPTRQSALFIKDLVEQLKIRDDLMHGVLLFSVELESGKHNFQHTFIGTNMAIENKNEFAGQEHKFKIYIRDYSVSPHNDISLHMGLEDLNGNILKEDTLEIGDIQNGFRKDYDYSWVLPADLKTGNYLLKLKLKDSKTEIIARNLYDIYILGKEDYSTKIKTDKKIALYKEHPSQSSLEIPRFENILNHLGLNFTQIGNLQDLSNYDVLIIPPFYNIQKLNRNVLEQTGTGFYMTELPESFKGIGIKKYSWKEVYPDLVKDAEKIQNWMRTGGRLLCFEQFLQGEIPWLEGFSTVESGQNSFVDPVVYGHPALKDLLVRNFYNWEGERGVFIDYAIMPLNQNLIAAVSVYATASRSPGVVSAVAEIKMAEGTALLSQLNAVKRYSYDSVATKYVNNLLEYTLTQEIYKRARVTSQAAKGEIPDQIQFIDNHSSQHYITGRRVCAQSFVPEQITYLARIEIVATKSGDPESPLVVELRTDAEGRPGNLLASAARKYEIRKYPDWASPYNEFNLNYPNLKQGEKYWIVMRSKARYGQEDDWKNAYHLCGWAGEDEYERGRAIFSYDDGKTWKTGEITDFGFKVWGYAGEYRPKYNIDPKDCYFIDLRSYANRSFTDEKADDKEGGWTDQGQNDLRHIPVGDQVFSGVSFEIIDPGKNNNKSCIILAGTERPYFPKEIKGIEVNKKLSALFFCHASAWGAGGASYFINYTDGNKVEIELKDGVNIGDWWKPTELREASVAWRDAHPLNPASIVGCYLMRWENPCPAKEIESIDFVSTGVRPVPILIAVTGVK